MTFKLLGFVQILTDEINLSLTLLFIDLYSYIFCENDITFN